MFVGVVKDQTLPRLPGAPLAAQSVFGGRHGGIDGVGKMKALAKHAPLQIVMILFKVLKDERVKMR